MTAPLNEEMPPADAAVRAPIDLRSDTVTHPTPAMYERMRNAALGDDGLDGDPTARALEDLAARTLGKEAGLYVPTATMGNLLAVLTQAQRQGQVVMEASAHMFLTERGGATLSGTAYLGVAGQDGAMDLAALAAALTARGALRTELVCMETTHVNAGGAVLPLAHMQAVHGLAREAGAQVHVDGARIFNAAVALEVPSATVAAHADTVSVCLSKGLSAPAGAVLVGPAPVIARARSLRKMLGGTQRQIGVLAATGLEAIESMPQRLAQDHAMARQLHAALQDLRPGQVRLTAPATNILFAELAASVPDSGAWARAMARHGVLVRPWGPRRIRLVTHRHISAGCIATAASAFGQVARDLLG